ncbi:MAG: nonstructural protein [Microvirus sp.]|nr:MAG: nonstructural protein [Microvirus sp.]
MYDSKVQTFAQPFQMRTKGEALRGWQDVCNDPSTQISKYPEDYSLHELGEYDEETGSFINLPVPLNLGLAASYKRTQPILAKEMN